MHRVKVRGREKGSWSVGMAQPLFASSSKAGVAGGLGLMQGWIGGSWRDRVDARVDRGERFFC